MWSQRQITVENTVIGAQTEKGHVWGRVADREGVIAPTGVTQVLRQREHSAILETTVIHR